MIDLIVAGVFLVVLLGWPLAMFFENPQFGTLTTATPEANMAKHAPKGGKRK